MSLQMSLIKVGRSVCVCVCVANVEETKRQSDRQRKGRVDTGEGLCVCVFCTLN